MKKTVKEFVEKITTEDVAISDLIAVKKYVSAEAKISLAKDVLDYSVEYDRGFVKFDSYKKHLAFIFGVIEAHSDLRFADDWNERMQEYDVLCENDLLNAIIDTFRRDYEASLEVIDMMRDDMLADNSIEASVAKLAQSVSENLDVFVGALADKLENLDIEKIIPKDLDLNKLQRLLNKIK
jgi:hypothetical protein